MPPARRPSREFSLALAAAGAIVAAFAVLLPRGFLANDDEALIPFFRENVLAPFVSPVLSQVLAAAYAWAPAVPWYGLWLYALQSLSLALVTVALLDAPKPWRRGSRVTATLAILPLLLGFAALSWRVSFTPCAIAACGSALLAFCTGLLRRAAEPAASADRARFMLRALLCGGALAAGLATRREAVAGAAIVLSPLLATQGGQLWRSLLGSWRRGEPGAGRILAPLAALLLPSLVCLAIAPTMPLTRDPAAGAFLRYNRERGRLHGHAAYTRLDERRPRILRHAGWTNARYQAFQSWLFLDEDWFSLKRLERLRETGGDPRKVTWSFLVEAVGEARDSAGYGGTLLLFGVLLACGLASVRLLDRRSGLLCLGCILLFTALAVAMQRSMRFPDRIALPLSLLAAAAVWVNVLWGASEDTWRATYRGRGWSLGSLATLLVSGGALVATATRLVAFAPRADASCEAFEARLAERRPTLVVAYLGAGCARDPLRADPRPYPTVILGWPIFSPPFYSGIAKLGAPRADALVSALSSDENSYVLAWGYDLNRIREVFRGAVPELGLETLDSLASRRGKLVLMRATQSASAGLKTPRPPGRARISRRAERPWQLEQEARLHGLRVPLVNQILEPHTVGGEQRLDVLRADVRHDDLTDLVVDIAEQAVGLHLLRLVTVVFGRADVVDRRRLVAMDQEQVDQRHQPLLAQRRVEGVLIAHRQQVAAAPVHDRREDHVGQLLAPAGRDAQLQ